MIIDLIPTYLQLLQLLDSGGKDSLIITNWCINALYERNPTVFNEQIFNPIAAPLLVTADEEVETLRILKTESEVSKSIENLSKCFITSGTKFKCLPSKLLAVIALPLFRLYNKTYRTVYVHRNTIRQLLLLLLSEESIQADLFAEFLDQNNLINRDSFGKKLAFQFGPNGGIRVTNKREDPGCEESGDCLFHLVETDPKLSYNLFCFLLKSLSNHEKKCIGGFTNPLMPDCDQDIHVMGNIELKLVHAKLLSILAETPAIQEAHINDPEHILAFVKSLIKEASENNERNRGETDAGFDVLYTSLMLIKVILTNKRKAAINWKPFNELALSLNELLGCNVQPELSSLIKELVTLIKTQGASVRKPRYQDLSENSKEITDFDKALKDLADPLLPIRAHGLMSLTKLVERSDSDAVAKRDIIFCLFQVSS